MGPIQDLARRRAATVASSTSWGARCTDRASAARSCRAAPTGRSCGPTARSRSSRATTIKSAEGALIYVQIEGLRVASPEILARMSRGELVPFDSYHFRTAPRFETAEPSLKWLERATFVGVAARAPDRVAIGSTKCSRAALGNAHQPVVDQRRQEGRGSPGPTVVGTVDNGEGRARIALQDGPAVAVADHHVLTTAATIRVGSSKTFSFRPDRRRRRRRRGSARMSRTTAAEASMAGWTRPRSLRPCVSRLVALLDDDVSQQRPLLGIKRCHQRVVSHERAKRRSVRRETSGMMAGNAQQQAGNARRRRTAMARAR